MANAVETTPVKKEILLVEGEEVEKGSNEFLVLSQEFEVGKKYMFEPVSQNPERDHPVIEVQGQKARVSPHKKFKPYQNIVLTSQVVWRGKRRMVRYYDGCDSIFVDKQPKEKDTIDQLIKQSKKRDFLEGKFGCYGEDRMLLLYMIICSWNGESLFRTRTADRIFIPVNADKLATAESLQLDRQEKALQLAKEAKLSKMMIHANYLGIQTTDWDSGNELTEKEIRTAYRKEALRNSDNFIDTYGNRAIDMKYYIEKALSSGTINNKLNPNKASWQSGGEICPLDGLKSPEGIANRIFEFSQSQEGEEFVIQLKALYEKD